MKRFTLFLFLTFAGLSPAFTETYFVAMDGEDSNPGTFEQPFKTFIKASSVIFAGDTLYIREGQYGQILQFARSGTYGNPIVVMAWPGEKVVITAFEPLSGWTHHEGDIYMVKPGWTMGQQNFVMHGDTACDLARWPNNEDGQKFTLNSLRNTGGSGESTISNAYLDYSPGIPDYDWSKGGSIFFYCDKAGWIAWKAYIKSNTTTRLTFDLAKNPSWIRTEHPPADLGDFYLEGIREALDYENEWYYDAANGWLYIQLPGGIMPADSAVWFRKRSTAINLNQDYIQVKNLEVLGGAINIGGSSNHVYGVVSRWGNWHRGIMTGFSNNNQSLYITGYSNRVEKCDIGYGAGTGARIRGSYNQVVNNRIHNFNMHGSYDAPVRIRDGGTSQTLSRNTIFRGGRDCIQASTRNTVISYNDVSLSNLIADDCGLYYVTNGPYNISIHHNWFHDTRSRGSNYKACGIYLDNDAAGFNVHHNVVWNTEWTNLQMNLDIRDINIYNNTFWNGSASMGAWHKTGTHFERVVIYNNLADNNNWESQAEKSNNLVVSGNPFVDNTAKNWQLKPGTAPIDYGRPITGYTQGYLGSSPDAGAYEYGQPMWTAGIDWDPELGSDACLEGDIYEEVNGIVVVEAESAAVTGKGWLFADSLPSMGAGYLEYAGPDETADAVDSTLSTWKVKISNPGTYRFLMRSRNGVTATGPEEQNSSWVYIESDLFYGLRGDAIVTFDTTFAGISVASPDAWEWAGEGFTDQLDSLELYATFNYSGIYRISIAGRSAGHLIDRLALFQDGRESFATDSLRDESHTGCEQYSVPNQWASPKQASIKFKDIEYTIDGSVDESWKDQPVFSGTNRVSGDPAPPPDLSYNFWLSANDSALFLLAYIKDDLVTEEDNLELFLNPDNNHLPIGVYGGDAMMMRFSYGTQDGPNVVNGTWKADDTKGFRSVKKDTTGGYILETRIPWKGISGMDADESSHRSLGLEIQVNDHDLEEGYEHKLAWANNTGIDFSMYDTRKFGSLTITRDINPVDVTGVQISEDTIVLNSGQIITLAANIIPANADNKTITWKALDATVVNLDPSSGIARGLYPGQTSIIVTTQDGGFTDTCLLIVPDPHATTDMEDLAWTDPDMELSLVPNPASVSFWVKGPVQWDNLEIYSITGELVLNVERNTSGEYISVSHLPSGLYMVRIFENDNSFLKKLIKSGELR